MTQPSAEILYSAKMVARRREVRRARVSRIRRTAITVTTLITLSYGGWAIAHSSLFALDGVELRGATHLTRADVLAAGGVRIGMNMLSIDPQAIASGVESLPLVDDARVERLYPSKLRIVVTERRPAGVVVTAGATWLIDSNTVVIAVASDALPAGVPIINVADASNVELGRRAAAAGANDAMTVWHAMPALLRPRLQSIDVPNRSAIALRLGSVRVTIGEATDLDAKFLALVQILEGRNARRLVSVDLRAAARPAARYW
jgi:cell division protein FtsQ